MRRRGNGIGGRDAATRGLPVRGHLFGRCDAGKETNVPTGRNRRALFQRWISPYPKVAENFAASTR